ncbi:MAG: type II secretion system F family protein [Sedimentisphaerales bacterium]
MAEVTESSLAVKQKQSTMPESSIKVKQSDLLHFTSQLSVMLSSGVVLSEAVESIAAQSSTGMFQEVLFDISDRLQNGESLSVTLSAYPKVFSPMFIGMVESSESTGKMPEMFDVLRQYIESEIETKKQIKGAMVYPLIMLIMAAVATTTLLFFVLPKFAKIYESRGQALPALTQLLMNCSKLVSDVKSASLIFLTLAVFTGAVFYALKTPWGKKAVDFLKIHTPVLGTMFIDAIMSRSAKIMASMLTAGVTLLDTLHIVRNACDNEYFYRFWSETCDKVEVGYQFSEAMGLASYNELVPPGVIQMIRAGEKGGNLGSVCDKINNFYERKLKSSIKTVTNLIEPLMIIIMGCIVGTIAIALLLPIFRISTIIAR